MRDLSSSTTRALIMVAKLYLHDGDVERETAEQSKCDKKTNEGYHAN